LNRVRFTGAGIRQPLTIDVTAVPVTSPANVIVRYENASDFTAGQRNAIAAAAQRLRTLLRSTPSPLSLRTGSTPCVNLSTPPIDEIITNPIVYVYARDFSTDPAFKNASRADAIGDACWVRIGGADRRTLIGGIVFNRSLLSMRERAGAIDEVALHEMLHALGMGSSWRALPEVGWVDLVQGRGTSDPRYVGAASVTAFGGIAGNRIGAVPVPVEGGAVEGSSESHWRESMFGEEIMTPTYPGVGWVPAPVSAVTVMSLADLGWDVDPVSADRFALGDVAAGVAADSPAGALRNMMRSLHVSSPNVESWCAVGRVRRGTVRGLDTRTGAVRRIAMK
jgi:hypothetical protein